MSGRSVQEQAMNAIPESPPRELAPHALVKGFLDLDTCARLADLAVGLHGEEQLTRNVFQVNTWMVRLDMPTLRPHPDDPRWPLFPLLLDTLLQRLDQRERFPDPVYGDFVSLMMPGGMVRPHRDDWKMEVFAGRSADEICQVRANVFLQKDPGSGDPLLETVGGSEPALAVPGAVETGDLLVFSPSLSLHAANKVRDRARIMVSFGFVVTREAFRELLDRVR